MRCVASPSNGFDLRETVFTAVALAFHLGVLGQSILEEPIGLQDLPTTAALPE
jgi:hypothetical protein